MEDLENFDKNIPAKDAPEENDEPQDEVFGDDEFEEELDASETDEDADEGTGDGNLGRSRDDLFQK